MFICVFQEAYETWGNRILSFSICACIYIYMYTPINNDNMYIYMHDDIYIHVRISGGPWVMGQPHTLNLLLSLPQRTCPFAMAGTMCVCVCVGVGEREWICVWVWVCDAWVCACDEWSIMAGGRVSKKQKTHLGRCGKRVEVVLLGSNWHDTYVYTHTHTQTHTHAHTCTHTNTHTHTHTHPQQQSSSSSVPPPSAPLPSVYSTHIPNGATVTHKSVTPPPPHPHSAQVQNTIEHTRMHQCQKSHIDLQRALFFHNRALFIYQRAVFIRKRAVCICKRALCICKSEMQLTFDQVPQKPYWFAKSPIYPLKRIEYL